MIKQTGSLIALCAALVFVIGACARGVPTQPVAVTGIAVAGQAGRVNVTVGETLQMVAQVQPANATNRAVTWSVEDVGVAAHDVRAQITEGGVLTGLAPGTVVVTARAKDASGVEGSTTIEVVPAGGDPSGAWDLTLEVTQDWFALAGGEADVVISEDLQTIQGVATMRVYDVAPAAYPDVLRLAFKAGVTSLVRNALPWLRHEQISPHAISIPPENRVRFDYDFSGDGYFTVDLTFFIQFFGQLTTHAIVDVFYPGAMAVAAAEPDNRFVVAIERNPDDEAPSRVAFVAFMVEVEGYDYWFPRDELEYRVTSTR